MTTQSSSPPATGPSGWPAWVFMIAAMAGAGVVACLLAGIRPLAPYPAVAPFQALLVERTTLRPGHIELDLRNATAAPITVSQVAVDQAFWYHTMSPRTVAPRGRAKLNIDYPWTVGHTVPLFLLTATGTEITDVLSRPVPTPTAPPRSKRELLLCAALILAPLLVAAAAMWQATRNRWSPRLLSGAALGVVVALLISATRDTYHAQRAVSPFIGGRQLTVLVALTAVLFTWWARKATIARGADHLGQVVVAIGVGLYGFGQGMTLGHGLATGTLALGARRAFALLSQIVAGALAIVAVVAHRTDPLPAASLALAEGRPAHADRPPSTAQAASLIPVAGAPDHPPSTAQPASLTPTMGAPAPLAHANHPPRTARLASLTLAAGVPAAIGVELGRMVGTSTWTAASVGAATGALAVAAWTLTRAWRDEQTAVTNGAAAAILAAFFLTMLVAVAA